MGARLNVRGVEQPLVAGLYADDTVLLAESEGKLQRIVDEFHRVCRRRKFTLRSGSIVTNGVYPGCLLPLCLASIWKKGKEGNRSTSHLEG